MWPFVLFTAVWASFSGESAQDLASLVDDFAGLRTVIKFTSSCSESAYGAAARSLLSPDTQFNVVSCGPCKFPARAHVSRKTFLWDGGNCDAASIKRVIQKTGALDLVLDELKRPAIFSAVWSFVGPGGAYVLASQPGLPKMAMDGVRCTAPCESPVIKCTPQTCTLRKFKFKMSEPPFENTFHLLPGSEAEKVSALFWITEQSFVSKFWPARASADEPTAPPTAPPPPLIMDGTTNPGEYHSTPLSPRP
jgi:hypothetical protein